MSPFHLVGGGDFGGISKTCTITVESSPTYILFLKSVQGLCTHSFTREYVDANVCYIQT